MNQKLQSSMTGLPRKPEPGRCVCGHKMHALEAPHKCWQNEVGTCSCTQYRGSDGKPFSYAYYRGGKRYDGECSIESSPKV